LSYQIEYQEFEKGTNSFSGLYTPRSFFKSSMYRRLAMKHTISVAILLFVMLSCTSIEQHSSSTGYAITVTNLVDDVPDLDIRRFRVEAPSSTKVIFKVGEASIEGHPARRDRSDVAVYDVILMCQLHSYDQDRQLDQIIKLAHCESGSIETAFGIEADALKEAIDLRFQDGVYPLAVGETPLGQIQDRTVSVLIKQ
jgi:hypothetical protein